MKISYKNDHLGGQYCFVECDKVSSRFDILVEKIENFEAFLASYLDEPFFMKTVCGKNISYIPKETQWLAIKHTNSSYTLYYSLACDKFRTSLYGTDNYLNVVAVTGDENCCDSSFTAFYKISGSDFYKLVKSAAESICDKYNTVALRINKPIPDFVNCFGWCTWDSFYDKVNEKDIRIGLDSFRNGGFVPKLVILDDGWQSVKEYNGRGEWRLSSFKPNEKFSYSLKDTIRIAKDEYSVEKFLVWHAILGYWGGIDTCSEEMSKYLPVLSKAHHTEELKEINSDRWYREHFDFGMINPDMAEIFYDDYHAFLKNEGVDGVKIDVQGSIPGHANGRGSRCELVGKIREGLEKSVCKNFNGELINCMSCNNDSIYHLKRTNVTRSSKDFYPNKRESHSIHVYNNAVNSIWLGEFTICDWDMFQTKHEYAQYHAAARAISGGPIYVSDRVDEHDFDLIKRLSSPGGKIFKAKEVAKLTVDSLFTNPFLMNLPFKIFNMNEYNGVVGVFSVDYVGEKTIKVSPSDIDGFRNGKYVSYQFKNDNCRVLGYDDSFDVILKKTEFEIVTFAKINNGFAIIGLKEKFNSGATFNEVVFDDNICSFNVMDSGVFVFYSEKKIANILCDGQRVVFAKKNYLFEANIEKSGRIMVFTRSE